MRNFFQLLGAVAMLTFAMSAARADSDPASQTLCKRVLAAAVGNDYDAFTRECDATMKAALTKSTLETVSKQLAVRVKGGYDAQPLGDLNQNGFAVELWRLRFKDGGDDILATISVKDGKVGGFFLR